MSNVVKVTTQEEFDTAVNGNSKVLVDFSAPAWCGPCKALAPHFEAAEKLAPDTVFVEVDIDRAEPSVYEAFNVRGVPTLLLFEGGQNVATVKARTALQIVSEIKR